MPVLVLTEASSWSERTRAAGRSRPRSTGISWALGEAILEAEEGGGWFDEEFCRRAEERIWSYVRPVTEWTNASLRPPAPHIMELFGAAAQDKRIADELVSNFNDPPRMWSILSSPERTAAFIAKFGHQLAALRGMASAA